MSESLPVLQLKLRVAGETLTIAAPQPPELARVDQLLPILRELDNAVIARAERAEAEAGRTISCCKGCSACCRAQPVPITPPEAYALLLLVEALPEPQQTEIRQRFAANVESLREAGLVEPYLHRDPDLSPDAARAIAQQYFRLGLVCPFLHDDACGIYHDRPFVCRQYLVTSPAALCADPFHNPVVPIRVPLAPAHATLAVTEDLLGRPQFTIPLALALEYAEAHRAELELTYPAQDLARRLIERVLTQE